MTVGHLISYVLNLYLVVLVARMVIDYVFMFNRGFRPRGGTAVVIDAIFVLTDPPLKALRRVLQPVRIGNFALDLSFIVLFIGLEIVAQLVSTL